MSVAVNRFEEALEILEKDFPESFKIIEKFQNIFFVETDFCRTASVKVVKESNDIDLFLNIDYILSLSMTEFSNVLIHESIHSLLRHPQENGPEFGFPNKQRLSLAHELIVNDFVESRYSIVMPGEPFYGKEVLQQNCSNLSTKEVYEMLEDRNLVLSENWKIVEE